MLYNEKAVKLFVQILENRPQMYGIACSLGLLLVEQKNTKIKIFSKLPRGVPQNNVDNLWQIDPYARTQKSWQLY